MRTTLHCKSAYSIDAPIDNDALSRCKILDQVQDLVAPCNCWLVILGQTVNVYTQTSDDYHINKKRTGIIILEQKIAKT